MNNPVALTGQSTERVHDELEVAFRPERGRVGTGVQAVYSRTSMGSRSLAMAQGHGNLRPSWWARRVK